MSVRPRQWVKNLALLAPLLFSRRVADPESAGRALTGLVAFSLAAAATYLANDLVDRERDRAHPQKRLRPVAAGELSAASAAAAAALLGGAAVALAAALGLPFLATVLGYLALQALYSSALKKVAVLDVFAIAAGFVLRVVAGAEVISVPISNWLYLCTLLLALFLALEKRRAELALLGDDAPGHRGILASYSLPLLDQLVAVAAGSTLLAYALYTVAPETVARFGSDGLKYTVPFVLFGLFRYLYLVHHRGEGGEPSRVLLRDAATQVNLAAWLCVVVWAVYLRSP